MLVDFGIAKSFVEGAHRLLSTPCGSLHYAAPEVLARNAPYGPKADVWSIGVISCVPPAAGSGTKLRPSLLPGTCCSAGTSFVGETNAEVLRAVAGGEGALEFDEADWANLSQAARDFVRHALAHDERARPRRASCSRTRGSPAARTGAVRPPPPRDVSAAWGAAPRDRRLGRRGPAARPDRAARPPRASG